MRISELSFERLMRHVRLINEALTNEKQMTGLLDTAQTDLPVIEEALRQLALLEMVKSKPGMARAYTMAQRDLVLLLAIRSIEQEEQSIERSPSGSSTPLTPRWRNN